MKAALVFGLMGLVGMSASAADRVEKVISYLRGEGMKADFSVVTSDIRDEVIGRLRKIAGGPFQEINGAGHWEYRILIRLGDEETMNQIVNTTRSRWLTGKGWAFQEVLAESTQPAIIPLIAEDFFRNDGDKLIPAAEGDIWYTKRPFSIEMCRVAFGVVAGSEVFAPEAREWAKESLERAEYVPPPLTREVVQQWWRENEAHFRNGDYRSVRPGELLRAAPHSAPAPNGSSSAEPVASAPTSNSTSHPIAATPAPESSASLATMLIAGAAVAVAVVAALLLFWKGRS